MSHYCLAYDAHFYDEESEAQENCHAELHSEWQTWDSIVDNMAVDGN